VAIERRLMMRSTSLSRSDIWCACSAKFTKQPQLRKSPIAFHGVGGHVQRRSRVFNTQPTKEPEFHDLGLPRVNSLDGAELVKRHRSASG
jgi:hypothetical protein